MPDKIRMRRGNKANLPTLDDGEFGLSEDTKELFIGTTTVNEQIYAPYDKTSAFRATHSLAQTLTAATFTKILFSTELFDHLSEFDPTTSKYTVQKAGIYLISASLEWDAQVNANRTIVYAYVNGVPYSLLSEITPSGTEKCASTGAMPIKLSATDYVEIYAYVASSVTTSITAANSYFTAVRIA